MIDITSWLLNILPSWVPIALVISSIIAFIISYVAGILPGLGTVYKEAIKLVSIMVFAFGFYLGGCMQYANHVKIETQKEIQYVDRIVTQQNVITQTVVKWYKQKQDKIGDNYVAIRKEITPADDNKCSIPQSFVRVHDDAAQGSVSDTTGGTDDTAGKTTETVGPNPIKLSDVEDTVTINYEQYHKVANQLEELQDWVKKEKAANP